jgi:threonylcarbamoyladenosine tRNA methylthiotransferase MtaB
MTTLNKNKTVAILTLGCKLNFAESSAIAQEFKKHGFTEVEHNEYADIYIVNTCSVTEHSDKKCRQSIRKMHKQNLAAPIIVTGCYSQLKPEEVSKIEGVSAVIGQERKGEIFKFAEELMLKSAAAAHADNKPVAESGKRLVAEHAVIYSSDILKTTSIFPAYSYGERTRSFLKVQDGCDYYCTYCTVPLARGHSRSVPAEIAVEQAKTLAAEGVKEIVLTGVNIGDYGRNIKKSSHAKDTNANATKDNSDNILTTAPDYFLQLLKSLNAVDGIERYRISSIEPNLLRPNIIDWIASGTKFQNHFHIPLQSGCDSVLARMRRRYNTKMFAEKIAYIREKMGDVFFGIDVIVGFPGETEEEFMQTYNFLSEEIKPAFLHIFPYSRRAGTIADSMPDQVPEIVKTNRVAALEKLSDTLHADYIKRFKGTEQEVLFEAAEKGGKMSGYTGNYIRIESTYNPALIGKIVKVKL